MDRVTRVAGDRRTEAAHISEAAAATWTAAGDRPPRGCRCGAGEHAREHQKGPGARRDLDRVRRQADQGRPCDPVPRRCLERTTDGRGAVAAITLAEIRRLDAGSWFGPAFRGEPVPTFEQALALCAELGLGINVEIKPCARREVETAQVTMSTLLDLWPRDRPAPLVSSFAPVCLRRGARPGAGAAARLSGRHSAAQVAGADGGVRLHHDAPQSPPDAPGAAGRAPGRRHSRGAVYGQRRLARTAAPRGRRRGGHHRSRRPGAEVPGAAPIVS